MMAVLGLRVRGKGKKRLPVARELGETVRVVREVMKEAERLGRMLRAMINKPAPFCKNQ